MRRFPPRETPPGRRPRREIHRTDGPFERLLRRRPERDPAPIIIGGTIAFLALVIVVVLGLSQFLGGSDDDGASGSTNSDGTTQEFEVAPGITSRQTQVPPLPPGLVPLSEYYEFEAEEDVPITLKLELIEAVDDAAGLGFYTFFDNRWQRLSEVTVQEIAGKPLAEGEFPTVPANLAVLRVLGQTYQVAAALPQGAALHGDARANIVSPRDYLPGVDGGVEGTATPVTAETVMLIPTIVGSSEETAAIVNEILGDDTRRDTHVDEIARLVNDANFAGIDLEYSAVDPELASEFTEFVTRLADRLHDSQKKLSLSLPPPSSQRQAYDWKKLGESADIVKVLPLADPIAYWESMPGALGQIVRDVPPDRVMLVINPFGIEDLGNVTRPIGYQAAMSLAAESVVREPSADQVKSGTTVKLVAVNLDAGEGASPLRWDDDAVAVSFAVGGTERRRIFLENKYSASFKLEIVQAYRLGGIAISDASASSDVANLWPTVNEFVRSATLLLGRPNDATMVPAWQAPEGGEFVAATGTTATWIAPGTVGTVHVTLVVSDGDLRFGRNLPIDVKKSDAPSPTPLTTFGPTPSPVPPTPAPGEPTLTPTPAPTDTLPMQIGKRADGDDADPQYEDPEETTAGSEVTYRIVIDNDAPTPVTIQSLLDDVYPEVVCSDNDENNVVGQTLAADDGDAELVTEKGPDAIVCAYTVTIEGNPGDERSNTVTIKVRNDAGETGSDRDTATVILT
jgi:hypothetical protein